MLPVFSAMIGVNAKLQADDLKLYTAVTVKEDCDFLRDKLNISSHPIEYLFNLPTDYHKIFTYRYTPTSGRN
jgi:hypothetical protein